jgi:poly-gamma-glutamate synthesis protein (capsule biosynthesis protein)
MAKKSLSLLAVGDIALQQPDGQSFFSLAAPVLKTGDVVVGQGEVVFTSRGYSTFVGMVHTATSCPPGNIGALAYAGFNVITLAGNHIWDSGAPGIEDTIAGLRSLGITPVGAGMNIDEARKPAIIERDGTRIGFLDYNCVGPIGSWATPAKPGGAFVHIITHYEIKSANPGGAPDIYTFAETDSLNEMAEDVKKLRPLCDVLVVVFHKGGDSGNREKLAMYDKQVSYAAIDAGADLILGHHAHVLKGIEVYKGKVIFHGLGDFVPAYAVEDEGQRKAHRFLSTYSSTVPPADSDPVTKRTIIAKCIIKDGKISQVGYLPCYMNEKKQPDVFKKDERGQEVFDFVKKITLGAGLNTEYKWKGNEVVIRQS